MSDRRRRQGSVEDQDAQVWSALKTKLASLHDVQAKVTETTLLVNELQKQWAEFEEISPQHTEVGQIDDDHDDQRRAIREKLLEALDNLQDQSDQEKLIASGALESLGILIALRAAPEHQLQVPADANKRKKRRLDASPAPSDISSARASPAPPGGPSTPGLDKVSRSLSRSLSINAVAQLAGSPSSELPPVQTPSTARSASKGHQPIAAAPTRKERKEAFLAQLPLKEGRPVAFKPPAKGSGKGAKSDPGSTDWILTRVVRCISGDKNRYEVQDVQDEQGIEGKPGASYNTTLKAILALPDPRDRSTYPSVPYAVGSDVYALYPDTTSFYKARVVGIPTGNKRQAQQYKLIFEDDNDEVKPVSADYVVEAPDR